MTALVVRVAPFETVTGEIEIYKRWAGLAEGKKRGTHVVDKSRESTRVRATGAAGAIGIGLEHQDVKTGAGEYARGHESVWSRSDDDDVGIGVLVLGAASGWHGRRLPGSWRR